MHAFRLLACALLLSSCDNAPQPVAAAREPADGPPAQQRPATPADHPDIGAMQAAPMEAHAVRGDTVAGACFGGTAVLQGELAEVKEGFLFINARRQGGGQTYMSMKMPVSAAQADAEGRRAVAFHLDSHSDMMSGAVPSGVEIEVEVRFDRDGFVDTKDDIVSAAVPAKPGEDNLVIVLGS